MAKFKRYDYSQKVLIPVCLEEQLVPGSLEFAIGNDAHLPRYHPELQWIGAGGWQTTDYRSRSGFWQRARRQTS